MDAPFPARRRLGEAVVLATACEVGPQGLAVHDRVKAHALGRPLLGPDAKAAVLEWSELVERPPRRPIEDELVTLKDRPKCGEPRVVGAVVPRVSEPLARRARVESLGVLAGEDRAAVGRLDNGAILAPEAEEESREVRMVEEEPILATRLEHRPVIAGEEEALAVRAECKAAIVGNEGALVVARSLQNERIDRKSTRLNSSHLGTSYAVFCL